jgi:pimeloyl-ACP methyl ester carboxylesterase
VSAIHLNNRLVHYELVGRRGHPIIFLHSWLGSWRYWLPTMDHISERHRAYALDFWGFGESDRKDSDFSVSEYVNMLFGFMDNMGLTRVNLAGHGLGGMVAIRAASEQPERFGKLMTVNTPILGEKAISVRRARCFHGCSAARTRPILGQAGSTDRCPRPADQR